jgi:16S rRNA (cytidine1402-2'-O)-methyltransferase
MSGTLFLFPTHLGDTELSQILPAFNIELIARIQYFIVEDIRSARRFLKKCNNNINIDKLHFFELNKRTEPTTMHSFIQPLLAGNDMGIISEAGCPAIADPGADFVSIAHQHNIRVIPLIGPSSILLALIASGFNGQSFAFNGYLPIPKNEKSDVLKKQERRIYTENQTQIYIETPYRNRQTFADILQICKPETKLCVAADLTLPSEYIQTKTINAWQKETPELNKRPCVFVLYK